MGVTGWPPEIFWNALFTDTMAAVEGVAMTEGAEMPDDEAERQGNLLTELDDLMRRYPDTPKKP